MGVSCIYAYKYLEKRQKEKINFDELPKKNSRIKIIRFKTKVLKYTFWNLNQEVLGSLEKLTKAQIKDFMIIFLLIYNK